MISFFLRLWSKISNTNTVFRIAESKKQIFLTFDDGPIPEVTPKVLDILKRYNAKATFFCVGDNIRKHPDCFERLKTEGHSVGNHTMHHLKASKVNFDTYINDVEQCRDLCDSSLFRPPYGRLSSDLKREKARFSLGTMDCNQFRLRQKNLPILLLSKCCKTKIGRYSSFSR